MAKSETKRMLKKAEYNSTKNIVVVSKGWAHKHSLPSVQFHRGIKLHLIDCFNKKPHMSPDQALHSLRDMNPDQALRGGSRPPCPSRARLEAPRPAVEAHAGAVTPPEWATCYFHRRFTASSHRRFGLLGDLEKARNRGFPDWPTGPFLGESGEAQIPGRVPTSQNIFPAKRGTN
jgi:hypothetical protein